MVSLASLCALLLHFHQPKKNIGKKGMLSIFFTESVFSTRTTFWPLCSSQLLSLIFFTATFPSAKKNIGEKGIYSNIFLKSWQQLLQTYMSQNVDFMGRVSESLIRLKKIFQIATLTVNNYRQKLCLFFLPAFALNYVANSCFSRLTPIKIIDTAGRKNKQSFCL